MIQVTATVKGDFAAQLQERIAKWQSAGRMAARIRVTEDLKWWVYQEFGTAPKGFITGDMAFTLDGKQIITQSVRYPGIRPKRMIEGILDSIHSAADTIIRLAFQEGAADNPELVHQAILEATQVCKELIVERFRTTFKDTPRENLSGRPEQAGSGTTAVAAFDAGAQVVDVSE